MTKVNDPGKDENQDNFGGGNDPNNRNEFGMNGIDNEDNSSSSGDDIMENEDIENNGYQLLPQEIPHSDQDVEENFADFDQHFDRHTDTTTGDSINEASANPSIQVMIQQARQDQRRQEIQERVEVFSTSTSGAVADKPSDNIDLDKNKIDTIKSSMSNFKLNSEPPNWLKEMSEDEWNSMVKNKIKK